jgi:hypothetical protein
MKSEKKKIHQIWVCVKSKFLVYRRYYSIRFNVKLIP